MNILLLAEDQRLIQRLAPALDTHGCHLVLDPRQAGDFTIVDLDTHQAPMNPTLTIGSRDADLRKPFSIAELLSQLCIRVRGSNPSEQLIVGDLVLNTSEHTVRRGREWIDLAPREFTVLEHLMRHAGCPVTRTTLLAHAWDFDYTGPEHTVDVCIRRIRAKIDDPWAVKRLRTARGVGYMISAPDSR